MIQRISLNGNWELSYHLEEVPLPNSPAGYRDAGWPKIQALVPGNVELDLVRAGIEPDPLIGLNLYKYRKYEFYQWWYEREFEVPTSFAGLRLILKLHGLDTYGTIWVNESLVGETDNMLIEHELDVTSHIRYGETNNITIRIASALNKARLEPYPINVTGGEQHDEFVWLRKPPASFGWDIAPRLVSAGIWRDIELLATGDTYLTDVYYATLNLAQDTAQLNVRYRFHSSRPILDGFSVRITGTCGDHAFREERSALFLSGGFTFNVQHPKLWWPKGYGEAHLYLMTFELLLDGQGLLSSFYGLTHDLVHPSDQGMIEIGEKLAALMKPHLLR